MKRIFCLSIVALVSAILVTACGGGGGGGGGNGAGGGAVGSMSFNVAGSESLIATKNPAQQASASFSGKIAIMLGMKKKELIFIGTGDRQTAKSIHARSASGDLNGTTNLFAVGSDGNVTAAIQSDVSVKVMYSVLSADGQSVYVALDPYQSQPTISTYNCAIFKVSVADNSFACLDEGYIPQDVNAYQDYYLKKINGTVKPIQTDTAGNVYYLGYERPVLLAPGEPPVPYQTGGTPVIRRIKPDGTKVSITPDVLAIQSFIVMRNGVLVYTYSGIDSGIKMYDPQTGSTNRLTDDGASQWWSTMFLAADDKETVVFGTSSADYTGVYFVQKYGNGGRYVVKLDTSLFGGTYAGATYAPIPVRLIIGDDGNLYGLFYGSQAIDPTNLPTNPMASEKYLSLFQLLPYDASPKATCKGGSSVDWWTAMNGMDFQVSKGHAYYVEKESHPSGVYSPRQVIKIADFSGGVVTLLGDDQWSQRYEIFAWKLVGDVLYFSGVDDSTSTMVSGRIDTVKLRNGEPASSYLTVNEVASVSGTSSEIQDMEVLKPQTPAVDTGDHPVVTKLFVDQENLYSASVKFSKYMDKDGVNAGVHLRNAGTAADVNAMKVWFYTTLHLIVDKDFVAGATTAPLDYGTPYELSVDPTVRDVWNWDIANQNLITGFTTRPLEGWYTGRSDATGVAAGITDGLVGKCTSTRLYDPASLNQPYSRLTSSSPDGNFRVQFSARNRAYWGELTLALRDAASNSKLFAITLSPGSSIFQPGMLGTQEYKTIARVFNSAWSRYSIDMFNGNVKVAAFYADGTQEIIFDKSNVLFSSGGGITFSPPTTAWDLDFKIGSNAAEFDDFRVIKLDNAGNEVGTPLLDETFSTATISSALVTTVQNSAF